MDSEYANVDNTKLYSYQVVYLTKMVHLSKLNISSYDTLKIISNEKIDELYDEQKDIEMKISAFANVNNNFVELLTNPILLNQKYNFKYYSNMQYLRELKATYSDTDNESSLKDFTDSVLLCDTYKSLCLIHKKSTQSKNMPRTCILYNDGYVDDVLLGCYIYLKVGAWHYLSVIFDMDESHFLIIVPHHNTWERYLAYAHARSAIHII